MFDGLPIRREILKKACFGAGAFALLSNSANVSDIMQNAESAGLFEIEIFDRKYDLHRPNGCTVLGIRHRNWPGNEFGLWLPETVFLAGKIVWCNWSGERIHQDWSVGRNKEFTWVLEEKEFILTSTLQVDETNSCLWFQNTFKNISDHTLEGLNTQNCFHLVNAPQFISIKGERIWANLDGTWTTTDRVPREESPDPRRVSFMKRGTRTERTVIPNMSFLSATMPEEAFHPLIMAENFDGNGSVGIACRDFRSLFNNNDYILRCIHSGPQPIELLNPGDSKSQDHVIIFCAGSHGELLEKYETLSRKYWGEE